MPFYNQALLDQESLAWLNQFAKIPFNSRQRTALAYLRKHELMTNSDYCRLNNLDSVAATKELKGLVMDKRGIGLPEKPSESVAVWKKLAGGWDTAGRSETGRP